MKKLLANLLLFVCSFAFAEHIVSLNFGPNMSIMRGTDQDNDLSALGKIDFLLGAEYDYMLKNNFMFGVGYNIGFGTAYDGVNSDVINATGFALSILPEFGFKFVNSNSDSFFGSLILHPIGVDALYASSATVEDNVANVELNYKASYLTLKSGARCNFQWGNNRAKNGFYIGAYVPWSTLITNVTLGSLSGRDRSLNLSGGFGIDLVLGYRLSLVF